MATEKSVTKDPFDAAKTIYDALVPLDGPTRKRVITSALSLLGMDTPTVPMPPPAPLGVPGSASSFRPLAAHTDRPISPVELIQQKQPSTNAQRIAVFAYYRDRAEGNPRFSRPDIKDYFSKARLTPPQNYDRDFKAAIQLGYIYEDGAESYLTSKGLEAVEAGFAGKAEPRGKGASKKKRAKAKAKAKRKSRKGR